MLSVSKVEVESQMEKFCKEEGCSVFLSFNSLIQTVKGMSAAKVREALLN